MSEAGVAGTKLLIEDTLAILETLTDEEWGMETGCEGWTVKGMVDHLAATFSVVISPDAALDGVTSEVNFEAVNDIMVNAAEDFSPAETLESYKTQAPDAIAAISAVQGPETAGVTACLGDVGTYEVHWFANAICFDHLCHLHIDVLAPTGPIKRDAPPLDEARLSPAMDWLLTVMPQWSGAELAKALTAPVDLTLTGVGAKQLQMRPSGGDVIEIVWGESGAGASITSDALTAMSWLTGRGDKKAGATLGGDTALAGAVLEAMRSV